MPEETVPSQETNQQTPFHEQFQTPGVKELMQAKGYKDVEALGLAYYSANKMLHSGKALNGPTDVIALPGEGAKPEEWDQVFTALGRPEKADAYKLEFEKDVQVDDKFVTFGKTLFHKLGVSQQRAQEGIDLWQAFVKERMTAEADSFAVAAERELGQVKSTWGQSWDTDVASGQQAVKALGLTNGELDQLERATSLPVVMKLLAKLGRHMKDGTVQIDNPEQAAGKIAELQADTAFQKSIRDKRDPAHQANLKRWEELHAQSYPAGNKGTATATTTVAPVKPITPSAGGNGGDVATLTADAAFQSSIRDKRHPLHAANLQRWLNAHAAKYPTRKA